MTFTELEIFNAAAKLALGLAEERIYLDDSKTCVFRDAVNYGLRVVYTLHLKSTKVEIYLSGWKEFEALRMYSQKNVEATFYHPGSWEEVLIKYAEKAPRFEDGAKALRAAEADVRMVKSLGKWKHGALEVMSANDDERAKYSWQVCWNGEIVLGIMEGSYSRVDSVYKYKPGEWEKVLEDLSKNKAKNEAVEALLKLKSL